MAPEFISESWAASVLPRREVGAHKWGVGGVVVVAGSPPFAGAAALCCAGAGRSGAGIVSAALPRSIAPVVVGLVPEVTVVILPEGESNSVAVRAAEAIGERLGRSAAMVVGPGLGDDAATAALLGTLFGFSRVRGSIGFGTAGPGSNSTALEGTIATAGKPVVVDADALNWLAEQERWWERVPAQTAWFSRRMRGRWLALLTVDVDEIVAEPESDRERVSDTLGSDRRAQGRPDRRGQRRRNHRCRRRPSVARNRGQRRRSDWIDWRVAGARAEWPGCRGPGGISWVAVRRNEYQRSTVR